MANLTKCDICGKEVGIFNGFRYFIRVKTRWFDGLYCRPTDICDNCMKEIKLKVKNGTH